MPPMKRPRPTVSLLSSSVLLAFLLVTAPVVAAPGAVPAPVPGPARSADAIIADYINAMGGIAAHGKHTTLQMKTSIAIEQFGLRGTMRAMSAVGDKAYATGNLPGIGDLKQGSDGKRQWAYDPINGLRVLDGAEAEQFRVTSAWNAEIRIRELYRKVESKNDTGPDGKSYECLVLTPSVGLPSTNCFDPTTHLLAFRKATEVSPQGETPTTTVFTDWRETGGIKASFSQETTVGPVTFTTRLEEVTWDQPWDMKLCALPTVATSGADPAAKSKPAKGKGKKK